MALMLVGSKEIDRKTLRDVREGQFAAMAMIAPLVRPQQSEKLSDVVRRCRGDGLYRS